MGILKKIIKELIDIRYWFQECKYYSTEKGCTKEGKCKRGVNRNG